MSENHPRLKLLVLAGKRPVDEEFLNLLRGAFDLDLATESAEALEALRSRNYDAVLAAAADYLPLERGLAQQQATALLNTIGEGVCVVSRDGRLLWANDKLKSFDGRLVQAAVDRCRDVAELFAASGGQTRRTTITCDQSSFDLICSAVRESDGPLTHVAAVVYDSTAARLNQQKMDAIIEAGNELVRLGGPEMARMGVAERMKFIENSVIRFTHDLLHYDHFVLRVLNERTGRLELLVSLGVPEQTRERPVRVLEKGAGIAGHVAATGRSYICRDTATDPHYQRLGMPDARSLLAVPLQLHKKIVGVMTLESHHPNTFGTEDRDFVEILANYIAIALNTLNLLTVERHSATSEITTVVTGELTGPLSDVACEAASLLEEYIGHDDMRRRLQRILDSVENIRSTVKSISEAPRSGVLPVAPPPAEADAVIQGKRVLIADDEELIRQTIRDVLERYGAVVDMAVDGAQAETMIQAGDYHLVLSDIKMPHRSGYEVFAAAKARDTQTAVILITGFGYDPNHSIVRANREGLSAVLFKPFKVNQLLDEVRAALVTA